MDDAAGTIELTRPSRRRRGAASPPAPRPAPPGTVTGQIAFRAAVGSVRRTDYSRPVPADPWSYSIGLGLLHAADGVLPDERMLGVILGGRGANLQLAATTKPMQAAPDLCHSLDDHDFSGIARTMQVPSPEGAMGLLSHGGVFLRRTRFPGPEGTVTHAVVAIMRTGPGTLPEHTMFGLDGTLGGLRLDSGRPCPEAFPAGSPVCDTLALPIWQARDGLRGVRSTLPLATMDACNEARTLIAAPARDEAQEARLAALMRGPAGSVLGTGRRDATFLRFQELAAEMGEPVFERFDTYPNAAETEAGKEAVSRVIRALMAEPAVPSMR